MLSRWLRGLTDEQLTTWSSRGLVRRASKALDGVGDDQITLGPGGASGQIAGHHQSLPGVGFETATCSCSATGLCHHLVCFVLALRARSADAHAVEDQHDAAQQPPYWRLAAEEELLKALGRTHVRAAERAIEEEVRVEWQESPTELTATIDEDQPVTVHLPALGELPASVCGCKKPSCMHRALAILTVRRHLGLRTPVQVFTLDEDQSTSMAAAQAWLLEVVSNGLVGLSSIQCARGHALATELVQADLPRPGRALEAWVARYGESSGHRAEDAPPVALSHLGEIWAVLEGLRARPLPRPAAELAGRHRRRYRVRATLRLLTLGPEVWRTATGYRGFSIHCLDLDSQRCCTFSEARRREQDPGWQPAAAMRASTLAGHATLGLLSSSFTLKRAAVSDDGRITIRAGTRLVDLQPSTPSEALHAASSLRSLRARFAQAIDHNPLGTPAEQMVLLRGGLTTAPRLDPYLGRWVTQGLDGNGEFFEITSESRDVAQRLADQRETIHALFGRASLAGAALALRPVIAYSMCGTVPLTVGS